MGIAEDGFPRCRTVTVGKHIAEDFSEVTVATRKRTRKCSDVTNNGKATVYWQDSTGNGAWVAVACDAMVDPDGDGEKAKLRLKVRRVEMQDYNSNITGCGTD